MPRVSEDHLTARREQILAAARRCFLRKGVHNTSMQDLIGEAGMSVGAVYRYFRSKDEIINAIKTLARHRPFFSSQVSEALLDKFNSAVPSQANRLTTREREIVQLIAEGNSNKKIAMLLDISVKTVETHRSAAMRKLTIRSTAELVRYAVRNKLIQA